MRNLPKTLRLASLCLLVLSAGVLCFGKDYTLFVGTYTQSGSKGIYGLHYDSATGKVGPVGLAAETSNPSFLTVDRAGKFLYSVNEVNNYQGAESGSVSAFSIDGRRGKLGLLNQVASGGAGPCYIALDKSGKFALIANYSTGNVAVLPISGDGRLQEASSVVKDEGALGPNEARQEKPHAHWVETTARNRFAYVADLGLDRVLIYKFDATKGILSAGGTAANASGKSDFFSAHLAPGTGPRHVAFSADGNFMFVLGELDSTVTVFANDGKETYRAIQKISVLPAGFVGKNAAAEIAIHPDGKTLYASNRGDDSIAVFSIDRESGKLTFVQRVPSGGKVPRHFAIDPSGKRLLVANQDSGNIVEFEIDEATGRLKSGRDVAKVPSAVCLVFVAAE